MVEPWRWQNPETAPHEERSSTFQSVKRAVLPNPAVQGSKVEFAAKILADFAMIQCGTFVAGLLASALAQNGIPGMAGHISLVFIFRLAILQSVLFSLIGYSERLYQTSTIGSPQAERQILAKCLVLSISVLLVVDIVPLVTLILLAFSDALFLALLREWRRETRSGGAAERTARNVMVIGKGDIAAKITQYLRDSPWEHRAVRGILNDSAPLGGDIRGKIHDLPRLAKSEFIDEVILAGLDKDEAQRALWEARRCRLDIKIVPDLLGLAPHSSAIQIFDGVPVITLQEDHRLRLEDFAKRVVDVACSSAGLLAIAPVLAGIALAIRLDSPGPVLYGAQRVGYRGHKFRCYKFRTMTANADVLKESLRACNERQGASFKIENDPRITRVGRWLRRYSLDELPQLWNVLRGEMSLVGPRPHPLDDFARYGLDDLKRLDAIPGLTGLWQVTARRDPSFARNVALDREYIEHWSLAKDFKIMMKTVSAIVQGSGT
jgi:exopolysaccharide biosynthesis polyprenyl glycosylphosphotransferase